ncbi:MAG: hypothetical protein JO258_03155 [Alphaproteobacteria bacterium]|nr:hypothetical protein [Alphaproteobacteria bacterium]
MASKPAKRPMRHMVSHHRGGGMMGQGDSMTEQLNQQELQRIQGGNMSAPPAGGMNTGGGMAPSAGMQGGGAQAGMQGGMQQPGMQGGGMQQPGMQGGMQQGGMQQPGMQGGMNAPPPAR